MNAADLLDEIAAFSLERDLFGTNRARVEEVDIDGSTVTRITNELWTARQRRGHSLHELSYRACFKAELPRFFIKRLTGPGQVVLDPFMGRGTTLLEAALEDRAPVGNDINPLARILIEPRLDPPELFEVAERAVALVDAATDPGPGPAEPELDAFYHPTTLAVLRHLRLYFLEREAAGDLDRVDRWIRMVATNRLTGHSSGFFSGRTMPPNQAVSIATQIKINERNGLTPPPRDVADILVRKSRSLQRSLTAEDRRRLARRNPRIVIGDATLLDGIETESVALTVTSPPFLAVVDYAKDNWLRCWFNGLDAAEIAPAITTPRRIDDWTAFVERCFGALMRVSEPGAWVVFEVGEVDRGRIRLEEHVIPAARAAGFVVEGVVVHAQDFTKTANCWGVANNSKGTNTNRLVLLTKPRRRH